MINELRSILERCWHTYPSERPSSSELYDVLERLVTNYVPEIPCERYDTNSNTSSVTSNV